MISPWSKPQRGNKQQQHRTQTSCIHQTCSEPLTCCSQLSDAQLDSFTRPIMLQTNFEDFTEGLHIHFTPTATVTIGSADTIYVKSELLNNSLLLMNQTVPWYSFLEAESTPGHDSVGRYGENPQRHHWESIPGPSDYQRSALTTTLSQAPNIVVPGRNSNRAPPRYKSEAYHMGKPCLL